MVIDAREPDRFHVSGLTFNCARSQLPHHLDCLSDGNIITLIQKPLVLRADSIHSAHPYLARGDLCQKMPLNFASYQEAGTRASVTLVRGLPTPIARLI
jgi:hypothetical protein